MIQERGVQARSAKSVFFEEVNDIDIYIEDTAFGYSKLFAILFSRVFNGEYKINNVFPLGGRKAVIEQFNEESSDRPSLYIIDGDLFLLTGDIVENKRGLYKFPYYCVENILCDPQALLEILDEEEAVKNIEELEGVFSYESWLLNNEEKLFSLFIEYAISMILNPPEQTVAFKVSDLVSCNKGEIDDNKLLIRITALKVLSIEKSNIEAYEQARSKVLNNFEVSGLKKLDVISGKDYLFPLLKTRGKSTVKTKISDINFKFRLAKICNLNQIRSAKACVAC